VRFWAPVGAGSMDRGQRQRGGVGVEQVGMQQAVSVKGGATPYSTPPRGPGTPPARTAACTGDLKDNTAMDVVSTGHDHLHMP
jgi:hypothetical protein